MRIGDCGLRIDSRPCAAGGSDCHGKQLVAFLHQAFNQTGFDHARFGLRERREGVDQVVELGAVGDPTVQSGVLERGLLLKMRFAFDQYVNLRPARLYPGDA